MTRGGHRIVVAIGLAAIVAGIVLWQRQGVATLLQGIVAFCT